MELSPQLVIVFAAAAVSFGTAGLAYHSRDVTGRRIFVLLMVAMGFWSLLSGLHTLAPTQALKVTVAKIQYLPIASVPLLWALVAHRVVGLPPLGRLRLAALAVIPLLTVAAAWTNDWHGWLWAEISPAGPTLVYQHGPWFWVAVAYNYALLIAALILLVRALRSTPPTFHAQLRVMIGAVCLPWVGNVLYLTHAIPIPGLDPTPLTFTLCGVLFYWALANYQFLDLVPIARSVLLDHIADGVLVIDRSWRLVDANPAARHLARLDASTIGRPLGLALPALTQAVTESLERGAAVLVEPFGPDRASIEVHTTTLARAGKGPAGWLATLRDITTQQSLLRDLRAEHSFSLQVMQTMGEGLTVTDAAGAFTFVNDAYARLTGCAAEDLIGRTPQSIASEEDRGRFEAAWAERLAGKGSTYLSRLRRADGRLLTVQVTGTPRTVEGKPAGSVAVITDLTERLMQEEALRTAEQTLRSFFDSAGVMMGIVELSDDDMLHIQDNAVAAAFFASTVEQTRGRWASALGVPLETRRCWLRAYRESERTGAPVQFDDAHEAAEGRRWLAVTVCYIGPAASGRPRCSYVALDVTARMVAEQELRRSQEQLERVNVQLSELARTDGLTGVRNRGALNERLAEEVTRAAASRAPLSLLLLDIDHFKPYNDTFGHVAGDGVLRAIGRIFQEHAGQGDTVARYGGEEFAIVLPNTDQVEAVLVAERIRRGVERTTWPGRAITVSIGVATSCEPCTVQELVELADGALYRAKEQGRNRVIHAHRLARALTDCCG